MRNKTTPRRIKITSTKNNGKTYAVVFQHWESRKANEYKDRQQEFVNRGELFKVE
jgi:hypothetical protein